MPSPLKRTKTLVLMLLLAAGITSCARHGIVTVETSNSQARGVLIGDVGPVKEGTLETIRLADVSPGVIDWGIGYGRVGGPEAPMGETLFLGGKPVRTQGRPSDDARFVGPFAVGLAPGQNPAARYRSAPAMQSASLSDMLSDLAGAYERPVLMVGVVQFETLQGDEGTDGQSQPQSFRNSEALLIAVVARSEEILTPISRRVFYVPEEMEGLVDDLWICKAAVLSNPPRDWRSAGSQLGENITSIVSVDPTRSRVTGGEVDVYLLSSLVQP